MAKRKPLRPCLKCQRPTDGSYCPHCKPKRTKANTTRRGYGADHQRMKREVLKEEKTCWLCGGPGTQKDPLTADHVVPLSRGGTNTRDNYRAAHRSCNSKRGNRLV